MTSLQKKKEIINNFEGFYYFNNVILYEDPSRDLVNISGNIRFEIPSYISNDYNYILGRCVQYFNIESLREALCAGASLIAEDPLFNNKPYLYILSWNENSKSYNGNITATNDLTQFSFIYNGTSIFSSTLFEVNNDENINKTAGLVGTYINYKTVSNNPSSQEIEDFLSNPENCTTINLLFEQVQGFLLELLNLYQQGKIKETIPQKWFSDTTLCPEQANILNDNLLAFYVNVSPNYYQTYFKQNTDIDNILKLYN